MQPDASESDGLGDVREGVRQRVRMYRGTVATVADEVETLPRRPAEQPALGLVLAVSSKRGDGRGRQVDRSARRPRLPSAHGHRAGVDVHLAPSEFEDLAAPHPGRSGEQDGERVIRLRRCVDEPAHLLGRRNPKFGRVDARRRDTHCGRDGDQLPPDGLAERRRHDAVALQHRRRRRAALEHLVDDTLHVMRADSGEFHLADARNDVHVDEAAVPLPGLGSDARAHVREPPVDQVGAERVGAGARHGPAIDVA
jgi:hypothetical protein